MSLPVPESSARRDKLLRRLTASASLGEGVDGYDLGVLSVVLTAITSELGVSPLWAGLIGASSLIGIFVGGPVVGRLTDRYGRRRLFAIDMACFVVLGLAQAFVVNEVQLFVVRLLLGVAIGAEYAIGAAMVAEFAPARNRGRRLSKLLVYWYGGFLVSVVIAYTLTDVVGLHWRWVLATSVVPAAVAMVVRHGLPESPRWLLRHGRGDEARAIVDRELGGAAYYEAEGFEAEAGTGAGWRDLLTGELGRRIVFVGAFWACQTAPYFAIFTFAPRVFSSLGLADVGGTLAVNGLAAVGSFVGMLTVERVGRRGQLIGPFWVQAAVLAVVGVWSGAPAVVIVGCFAVFAFVNAYSSNLTAVYPIELFPTEVRSSAVGLCTAISRVAAAAGTFLLPVGISAFGISTCMIVGAAIALVGGLVSRVMAPETTGQSLAATAATAPKPAVATA